MKKYAEMSAQERQEELKALRLLFEAEKAKGLKLDMSRGKPAPDQLDMSMSMLEIPAEKLIRSEDGTDARNYGVLAGLPEARKLFADLLGLQPENIIVGGQSSLNLMYDCISKAYIFGVCGGSLPWGKQEKVKFLCPAPGYDRHFRITQDFGFELISVPMTSSGPDMNVVREYVENDPAVKGIWVVPKYSNPQGITCSPETVEAFAALKPAADDFRIFWDNAYAVHGIREEDDYLLNIFDACKKYGSENMVYEFASTSKITFPGAGFAVIAASEENVRYLLKQWGTETIGHDKINQLRHCAYFGNADGIVSHMKKHAEKLRPKFDCVLSSLSAELAPRGLGEWTSPNGGYFVCYKGLPGTAVRCVQLCAEAGVKLTGAGAPFPYGIDPEDSTIRIAPSYPSPEQLAQSMVIFCICQRIASLESLNK